MMLHLLGVALAVVAMLIGGVFNEGKTKDECEAFGKTTLFSKVYECKEVEK